jgi:hypothetical protein
LDLSSFGTIIDIGANDFSLLLKFVDRGYAGELIGIDPIIEDPPDSIVGICAFGEDVDYGSLGIVTKPRLIVSSHTFEHVANPSALMSRIAQGMGPDDVLVLQTPSIEGLVLEHRFDQVHHQHLHYYSFDSLTGMLKRSGLTTADSKIDWLHYGAWMFIARKGTKDQVGLDPRLARILNPVTGEGRNMAETVATRYEEFSEHRTRVDRQLSTNPYVAFGGGLMLPVLAYHFPSMWTECVAILDDSPDRIGWQYANTPLPITSPTGVEIHDIDCLVTGAVSKASGRRIVGRLDEMNVKNIYFPTPGF